LLFYAAVAGAAESVDGVLLQQRAVLAGTLARPGARSHLLASLPSAQELTQRVLLGVTARTEGQRPSEKRAHPDQQIVSQRVLLGTHERG
jgi:hypothetical protein